MWNEKSISKLKPKRTRRWQHAHQTVTCRWSQDSLSSAGNRQEPQRSPLNLLTIVGGAPAENLVISRGNRPVAEQSPGSGRQAPAGWLYDMVQGQENPAVSCRSRKIGIRQKSTGHRVIYVSWDVGFRWTLTRHIWFNLSSLYEITWFNCTLMSGTYDISEKKSMARKDKSTAQGPRDFMLGKKT